MCALPHARSRRGLGLSLPLTSVFRAFISPETELMSLCSGVAEHLPLCRGQVCLGELEPSRYMHPQEMVLLFLP